MGTEFNQPWKPLPRFKRRFFLPWDRTTAADNNDVKGFSKQHTRCRIVVVTLQAFKCAAQDRAHFTSVMMVPLSSMQQQSYLLSTKCTQFQSGAKFCHNLSANPEKRAQILWVIKSANCTVWVGRWNLSAWTKRITMQPIYRRPSIESNNRVA